MRALPALLLLAACAAAPTVPPREGVDFVPDANGLGIAGSAQRIDFDRAPQGGIPVMDRELGSGRVLPLAGCPGGVATREAWGTLELTFTAERFVGWRQGASSAGQVCG